MIKETRETLVSAIESLTSLDVVSENKYYKPTLDNPYIRTTITGGEPIILTRGPSPSYYIHGIFQIDLIYPTDVGTTDTDTLAKTIVSHFMNNRQVAISGSQNEVRIKNAWQSTSTQEPDWYIGRVEIRYETYY